MPTRLPKRPKPPIDAQSISWDVIISITAAVKLTRAEYPPHSVDCAKHHLQSYSRASNDVAVALIASPCGKCAVI